MSARGPTAARHGLPRATPAPTSGPRLVKLSPPQLEGLRYCAQGSMAIRITSVTGGAPTQATLAALHDRGLITAVSRQAGLTPPGRALLNEFGLEPEVAQ